MKDYIPKVGERVPKSVEYVTKCNRLLDVGCGDGIIQFFIGDRVKKVYGIDNSYNELKKASRRGVITKHVDLDSNNFPFRSNFFDTVTCLDVIEHVRDPKRLVHEINRVLKKNGRLIIATPNIRFTNHLTDLVIRGKFPKTSTDASLYDGGHIHFFTYQDMIELLINEKYIIDNLDGIINKAKRGWKGLLLECLFGKKIMLEFRAPGILIVATKA